MYLLKLIGNILTSRLRNHRAICPGKDDVCPTKCGLQNTAPCAERWDSAVTCQIMSRCNEERELKIAPRLSTEGSGSSTPGPERNSLQPLLWSREAPGRRSCSVHMSGALMPTAPRVQGLGLQGRQERAGYSRRG